jgi:hypothetical protein
VNDLTAPRGGENGVRQRPAGSGGPVLARRAKALSCSRGQSSSYSPARSAKPASSSSQASSLARDCWMIGCSPSGYTAPGSTLPTMLSALANRIDRGLAKIILAHARRRWPLLTLIPAGWLRPLASPLATRLRRSLARGAITTSATIVVVIVLVAVLP